MELDLLTSDESEQNPSQSPGLQAPVSLSLRESAYHLLEFPSVRQALAGHTRFFRSRELAEEVTPQRQFEDVERLQEETAEAALMLTTAGDIGLTGNQDVRPVLRRAALGGLLTGQELMTCVVLLESTWTARNVVLSMDERTPHMRAIASDIPDLSEIKREVSAALTATGDVRDSATPRLGKLRSQAARAYQRLVRILERIAASPDVRSAIQSTNIATRGDRLVLEVRTDRREFVQGIVHDVSNTGLTLFVEPFRAVEPCNQWREAAAEAQREEERVLWGLSQAVGDHEVEATTAIEAAADLDLITARARLARTMEARRPETLPAGSETTVRFTQARHPLLGADAVPVSISIGPGFKGLVITGPNTGGKTVALKTLGLLSLMHQCGMQIPAADGTALSVFDSIYADIGDAQSIERSVSTFSSHMGRVIKIIRESDENSLVLLDELGTGTDPEEGAALARSILAGLVERGIPVAVTTHHRAVAEFAGAHERMENASVELDSSTLRPTYQFIMGVPGRSYAIHVARNLGLPEPVLERAEALLDPERKAAESLLDQIQRERETLGKAARRAEEEAVAAESLRRDLEARLSQVTGKQEEMVHRTRMELRREADNVRRQLRRIVSQAESRKDLATAQRAVNRLKASIAEPTWLPIAGQPESESDSSKDGAAERPVAKGDDVEIIGLNVRARVISLDEDGTADLQMGNARIQLNSRQLRRLESTVPKPAEDRKRTTTINRARTEASAQELDVRGSRVAGIEDSVSQYVDSCLADGRDSCRVIHGSGSGVLREAVRDVLSRLPQVSSFEPASRAEGGNGVTVVTLH